MIVDAHCHCWASWPYPRAAAAPPIDVARHGSAERLLSALREAGVDRALVVAAGIGDPPQDDDAYVADAASRNPELLSWFADLDSRWSPRYHDGHATDRLADVRHPSLVGVTHYLADSADGWWESPDAEELGDSLAARHLALSLHAPPVWHPSVAGWARRHPDVPVLLHHLGLAADAAQLSALLGLAAVPSLHVKASGFPYVARGTGPGFPTAIDGLRRIVDAFGPARVLWGSDFPVSPEHGVPYAAALDLVREGLAGHGLDVVAAVLGGSASALFDRQVA